MKGKNPKIKIPPASRAEMRPGDILRPMRRRYRREGPAKFCGWDETEFMRFVLATEIHAADLWIVKQGRSGVLELIDSARKHVAMIGHAQ